MPNAERARDLLQRAMLKAGTPGPACWVPERGRLVPYVLALLKMAAPNDRKRAVYRREIRDERHFEATAGQGPNPVEALVEKERIQASAAVVAELRADLVAEKDDDAVGILDVIGDDVFKRSEIAAETGLPVEAVDNARKRIKRAYLEVIARRLAAERPRG
jgi:DNA-directed RNA polymerase specialized sigma24 family protein